MGHWHIVNFHNTVATTFKHHISKSNGFNSRLEGIKNSVRYSKFFKLKDDFDGGGGELSLVTEI